MKNIMGIYMIQNIINDNFYIGSSVNIYRRWREHKSTATNIHNKNKSCWNYPIYLAIRKYGINNFKLIILEEVQCKDNLIKREIYWYNKLIPKYNQMIPEKSPKRIIKHSKKSKEKISRHNAKYWKGKNLPQNMIDSIIQGSKSKKISIIMLDKQTLKPIKRFEGYCDALKFLGHNPNDTGNIKRCCLDKTFNKTAYGYKWMFCNN